MAWRYWSSPSSRARGPRRDEPADRRAPRPSPAAIDLAASPRCGRANRFAGGGSIGSGVRLPKAGAWVGGRSEDGSRQRYGARSRRSTAGTLGAHGQPAAGVVHFGRGGRGGPGGDDASLTLRHRGDGTRSARAAGRAGSRRCRGAALSTGRCSGRIDRRQRRSTATDRPATDVPALEVHPEAEFDGRSDGCSDNAQKGVSRAGARFKGGATPPTMALDATGRTAENASWSRRRSRPSGSIWSRQPGNATCQDTAAGPTAAWHPPRRQRLAPASTTATPVINHPTTARTPTAFADIVGAPPPRVRHRQTHDPVALPPPR